MVKLGTKVDNLKANKMLHRVSELRSSATHHLLANLYSNGHGIGLDMEKNTELVPTQEVLRTWYLVRYANLITLWT